MVRRQPSKGIAWELYLNYLFIYFVCISVETVLRLELCFTLPLCTKKLFNERTCEPMYLNKISVILMYPVQIMYVRLNILDSFIWALHTMFSK
jgi:hypothetical protein